MRAALAALQCLALVAYPLAVYAALTRWGARGAGALVLAFALLRAAASARGARREHLLRAMVVPGTIALLVGASALARDARLLLATPALVSLALLVHFARSLRTEVPLVERFARTQVDDLSPPERAWCRGVTAAWCVFLALNAAVAGALALAAPVKWWALYTGGVSYGLMGLMFAGEYLIRSYRFRRYGDAPHDRLVARIWPAPRRSVSWQE